MSYTIKDLLLNFPHVALASEAENHELLEFYHQTELSAKTNTVIYKRGKDFFQFLKERSEHYLVFTLRDDNKKLQGVGVASYRRGFINGELTTVGYLGDLRISLNRKLIREWRLFYTFLLEKSPVLPETNFCRYYQTALMSTNSYSKNNLAETKIPQLHYKELAAYQMINIVGKLGFSSRPTNTRFGKEEDRTALIAFLQADHSLRAFGHDWTNEFDRRLQSWKNFQISDMILVTDKNQNIIAATSVWDPIESKQIVVPQITWPYKVLEKFAKWTPGIKLKPIPQKMIPIKILYLNQISFSRHLSFQEKQSAFKNIVDLAFNRDFNMLAYCDFDRDNLLKDMKHFITQKMSMGLYTVHFKNENDSLRDELFLGIDNLSPAFDMALV